MANDKLRRQILHEAARLMLSQQERDYGRAKIRAARKCCKGWVKPRDLPSDQEIRVELHRMALSPEDEDAERPDRFQRYRTLLAPLARVNQHRRTHPEGDVLYHSLQVFELARDEVPYDEEFLLAALLHDVGKGIDPLDHVNAGLRALEGTITERTRWLIANHHDAHRIYDGSIGGRARRRLHQSEDFDELLLLAACDRGGRQAGAVVPELDEALAYLRELQDEFG